MTKFIIVRHGQSKANEGGYLAGVTDVPLSSLGEKQANAVCQYILNKYKIDAIYSSPLERACNTVKGVADALDLPIIKEDNLIELDFGELEGLTLEEIKNNFDNGYGKWANDPGVYVPKGGEAMIHLQARVVEKLKEIAKKEGEKTVLIGSHSSVIRALQCYIQDLPLEKMKNTPWVVNASLAEINFDGENFYIFKYGYDGHLINL
ncbi:MAG: histidine phosphatase family protein [Ruminococcaceae bacterium]|nr:histidine phosphatase family protein [Oscillospiraceae bacterium]